VTLLSHYTNRAGLEGIARGKTLWATRFTELNDKTEMEYGYVKISKLALKAALAEIDKHLIPGHPRAELDYDTAGRLIAEQFRKSFSGPTGSEPLYVFSFAEGRNEDQERRGILTLWDRYTKLEGYCVQFDPKEVLDLLSREPMRRNYALLELAAVQYGIDETDDEFLNLRFQFAQHLLRMVAPGKPGLNLKPQYERLWPLQTFALRVLSFLAKHKDAFFEDERETRIMAVPQKEDDPRVLGMGLALRKPVKVKSDGRHYIDLGADWQPGIEPRRIIVGPRARRDLNDVLAFFDRKPARSACAHIFFCSSTISSLRCSENHF
jgi:hypothetical protein